MGTKKIFSFLLLIVGSYLSFCQPIKVYDQISAEELVKNVLINSPCASASNISVKGANFGDNTQSYGYFTKNGSNFPFADGIILSTGKAVYAEGPNTYLQDVNAPSWYGDSDLEKALNLYSNSTVNATVIEFDFLPIANKISFDYIFASEEYHDTAQCIYSDGFAFLLKRVDEPDSAYQNLALIPNTNIPVMVTTVHPYVNNSCPAQNEQYFGNYNNAFDSPINFNGQTVVLTAKASVTPNVAYHIKLVIADEANYRYDSAIFLGGGSFKVETDLGEDRTFSNGNPLCYNESLTLNAAQPNATAFQWYKDGVPISGATQATYTVTPPSGSGTYSVSVSLSGTSCISQGQIKIEYSDFQLKNNGEFWGNICDFDLDGLRYYNLTALIPSMIENPEQYEITFWKDNPQTNPSAVQIANPTNFPFQSANSPQTIYAKITNKFGCSKLVTLFFTVTPAVVSETFSLAECDDNNDGKADFSLSSFSGYTFFASLSDVEANKILSTTNLSNTTIYGLKNDGSSCGKLIAVNLNVLPKPAADVSHAITLCPDGISEDNPLILNAISGYSSYLWNNGKTNESIEVAQSGTYSVQIFNENGCYFTETFEVKTSIVPKITEIKIKGSTLEAVTDIQGNFEFSLNGITWQSSPVFAQLPSGKYTIYVRTSDSKCLGEPKQAVIFFIPNFFSPNGDGINDEWRITGLEIYPEAQIQVFDRYGRQVLDAQPKRQPFHWDGKLNGRSLPQGTYWYIFRLNAQTIFTGWVTLKNYEK
ncbi:MAG: T9SS type B sorting domain-containing protein [Flavobacteriaceae bacterium]|jgi:gliding motility-associated-like protein|nr:T9SS type B sorting domain-containing protein [Flavobacteriaceae bacterium]